MLGKLLKYEIKAAGFILPALYAAIGLAFCFGKLADAAGINQLLVGFAVFSVIAGVSAGILALITSIVRYHKSMFCEEGYLLQTLPVSKGNLLVSKVLSTYIWLILGLGALTAGIVSCVALVDGPSISEIIDMILKTMPRGILIFVLVSGFVQLFLFIAEVYFSMTLANIGTFSKYNVLFSVIFYFVCNTVVGLLEVGAMLLLPFGLRFSEGKTNFVFDTTLGSIISNPQINTANLYEISLGIGSIFIDILAAVILLIISTQLLKKKITLK